MRDPRQVFARYGRQLLVDGVAFEGQGRLHGWAAVLAADSSEVAQAAAQAAGRYLVGAGIGRVVAPSAWAGELQALDADLVLLDGPGVAEPPVAHFWFAQRPYGASIDVAVTDVGDGWAQGLSGPARVATLRLDLGGPAAPEDAVVLGAIGADLLVADVLGVESLPALIAINLADSEAPTFDRTPRRMEAALPAGTTPPPGLLAELDAKPLQMKGVHDECLARYPNEACGLLLRDGEGTLTAMACPNLQDRYHALDPAEYPRTSRTAYKLNERLIAKAEDAGQRLVGIWHSHCDAGAYFSGEDVRCAAPNGQALYPGVAYLVVSVMGGAVRATEMYHFDADTGGFVAEPRTVIAAIPHIPPQA